ncbi:hypothetical protein PRZ48_012029 [Zasmidium cellare]|uniref:NAD-dependent epimerase/dehydratase domain-containing protein n=1 Tax=Zasmidium cellare TaxID=395010 RepID=A0ABR0E906_ZASCE|nr:hypothetical protein PRZ48_012029 [Zasmidium cellare]
MHVLLTGGSGFIAAHILDGLLQRGHSVVVTVRSQGKADLVASAHRGMEKHRLDFVIVEDIAREDAFQKGAVIHTASPFHFNTTNVQKDLLDPAIIGTKGILKSIEEKAPSVRRVVITSSFAAVVNGSKGFWPEHTYSEADWNPITKEEASKSAVSGYRASKTFAERAAWEFIEQRRPKFTLTTICPPLVFGPVKHLSSPEALNTCNQRIRDIIQGTDHGQLPPGLWVDVRDLALGHVLAMEKEDAAANKRFFFTPGTFSSKEVAQIVGKNFPELQHKLQIVNSGDNVKSVSYNINIDHTNRILGVPWTSLEKSVVDTVHSIKTIV